MDYENIEKKWQKVWEDEKRFEVPNHVEGKENKYVLIEFPYPSGIGLHLGHCRSYTAIDAYARKKRLEGYNVMFPFGTDAYGLEAERTAIREKKTPQEIVERNIATFQSQVKAIGMSIDWSRTINTCDPEYYKWTQWQFIQFVKAGLAEKREMNVNYCPNCGVLANEEVEDGTCCQCHAETTQKSKAQWVLKMTEYADRLADDLSDTDFMEHIKTSQINWIGKSEGVEVTLDIVGGGNLKIFTTCIETIYGITFVVVAPESSIVDELKPRIKNWSEVEAYRKATAKKSEFDRAELNKDKTGCILDGIMAINPATGREVPVYIGDFVIASYGTGAVMAVPTHDQRDYEFADKYGIDKIQVIEGDVSEHALEKADYLGKGIKLINSEEFSGLTVEEAKVAITDKLVAMGVAERKLNFRMRDWIFSRQRYWGEPIPMIHCDKCGWVPVPDDQLPVHLPKVESYEPTKDGESPLSLITDWVNTTCPCCGAPARRETDTMPGWAGSSWYFMRYCDANNDKEFASMDALKSWLPIDLYNGGNEHTTRHLLYARFWNKFLYDQGLSPVSEPFKRRISQGLILGNDGKKMSKSAGNGVDPKVVIKEYSADALRLWMSFIGDYFETATWSDDGVRACHKFLGRVENLMDNLVPGDTYSKDLEVAMHTAIKKVSLDIDNIKFNTAISALMILLNEIGKVGKINHAEYKTLLTLLNPFAPHVTEELWTLCKFEPRICDVAWPTWDENKLIKDEIEYAIQINNKIVARELYSANATTEEIETAVRSNEKVNSALNGKSIIKVIVIKNRLVNIIAK
ncbi:MAG: leucine--tRNA ligase [Clostridiales bacterium]|nr:leucine--tRNA ligase [Clostridiales bacterium]